MEHLIKFANQNKLLVFLLIIVMALTIILLFNKIMYGYWIVTKEVYKEQEKKQEESISKKPKVNSTNNKFKLNAKPESKPESKLNITNKKIGEEVIKIEETSKKEQIIDDLSKVSITLPQTKG